MAEGLTPPNIDELLKTLRADPEAVGDTPVVRFAEDEIIFDALSHLCGVLDLKVSTLDNPAVYNQLDRARLGVEARWQK